MAMMEIQLGEINLRRMMDLAYSQMINSNLFLRSLMISIIFFFDETQDMTFIRNSIICQSVIDHTEVIVTKLLDEIMEKPLNPNNKSTVITCLMTIYLTKHLGLQNKYEALMETLKTNEKYRKEMTRIVSIGFLYFSSKPSDTLELMPVIYVNYNPQLVDLAHEVIDYINAQ
mmetsp:Transcript_6803/g.10960  ORF Transcript_6803/g.10960 Transcript_6803/m.10960 type:complete len:172 (-) Transcript_6803:39-554(-)